MFFHNESWFFKSWFWFQIPNQLMIFKACLSKVSSKLLKRINDSRKNLSLFIFMSTKFYFLCKTTVIIREIVLFWINLWTISRIITGIYLFFITMVSVVQYLFLTSNFYHSWQKLNFFSLRGKSFFFLKSTFICYFSKLFCFRNSLWKVLKIAEEISVMIF